MAALYVAVINGNKRETLLVSDLLTDQDLEELDYEGCKKMAKEWAEERGYSYIWFVQDWDGPTGGEGEDDEDEGLISISVDQNELLEAIPHSH